MRKVISSLITVMIVIALLTGCGNANDKSLRAYNSPNPPNLTVKIANQEIPAIIN
jgi:PBP1b-binding outer membrane lipoprotein LpoB